ncbi:helix-turn-helix transcriptional regulator [Streptomyces buecherae]|uniref:Helix-turn-helix transcriptional regulator n=2 Tax=Streptomyces buecherae TaxID=2763006 RepID=A0A7H8N7Q3_9ACTN|nr:helix-turn-helix transcriptional regulator [Streptomyces buecherae]QKW50521.1 helix-turn-helix transcriptional regulator [Streptomyces buecherae]
MSKTTHAMREAARGGDFGRVIALARRDARLSQRQLGVACGVSQSAVSRLEHRGSSPTSYDMALLARAATHLRLPLQLVGLADHAATTHGIDVERRNFIAGATSLAITPISMSEVGKTPAPDVGQAATLRVATSAFRRLEGGAPSRQLAEPVLAHLRLVQALAGQAQETAHRARLASAASEVASLAGWLSWDMGDHGSARTWYGTAIRAAHNAGDPLLRAYQIGSLAQFEANTGNAAQSIGLAAKARRVLGDECPTIADAWLSTVEALAHAAAGDRARCDASLVAAARLADQLGPEPPPWPWVFTFNANKVASVRISCGARLGIPRWVFASQDMATTTSTEGREKQGALLTLDIAAGHIAMGRLDGAFSMALQALEIGLRFRSGRIVEQARLLRRSNASPTPPKVVREFDERLHDMYL